MDKINNLLQQVSIIQKKYDDLAEYSGEHYNVFDILGVRSDELSHSAILTNLLDAKGRHGQKDLFLELFLETIKSASQNDEAKTKFFETKTKFFEDFKTKNTEAVKEKYVGRVDYDAEQGGRIDIVINDGKNNIIIENKVYAGDQPMQLVRYNEYDENAPIFYLTLDGKEASDNSKGKLTNGKEYVCISYQNEIVSWLEKCIKEMTNKPIIRETLNQYLFLIKNLTNQSNNNKMKEEISLLALNSIQNFESVIEITKSLEQIRKEVIKNTIIPILKKIAVKNDLNFEINSEDDFSNVYGKWLGFTYNNRLTETKNTKISFQALYNLNDGLRKIGFGLSVLNIEKEDKIKNDELIEKFKLNYRDSQNSPNWYGYKLFSEFSNWENLDTLKEIQFNPEAFEKAIDDNVKTMLNILNY